MPALNCPTQLTWLARQMQRHNQSIFLIEQLQPSWLENGPFPMALSLSVARRHPHCSGHAIMWSFIQLIGINPPHIEVQFLTRLAALFGVVKTPGTRCSRCSASIFLQARCQQWLPDCFFFGGGGVAMSRALTGA